MTSENQTKCKEKACPFPADGSNGLCTYHLQMFSVDSSPSDLSIEATDEDLYSAIFYDKSMVSGKRGIVSVDEWLEDKEWHKTHSRVSMAALYKRRRHAGLCSCGGTRAPGKKICDTCIQRGRDLIHHRKANGLCTYCGENKASTGHRTCLSCKEKLRLYSNRYYHERISPKLPKKPPAPKNRRGVYLSKIKSEAQKREKRKMAGRCVACGRPKDNPTSRCDECRNANNARTRTVLRLRSASGMCVSCGKQEARIGRTTCMPCGKKNSLRAAKIIHGRIMAGICMSCGNSPTRLGKANCADCAAKAAVYRKRRGQVGRCLSCGNPNDRKPKKDYSACAAKASARAREARMKNPNHERRRRRMRQNRLRRAGICIGCGKHPSAKGTICRNCRERKRRDYLVRKASAAKGGGLEVVNEQSSKSRHEDSAGD
jgi:hypothetical protein